MTETSSAYLTHHGGPDNVLGIPSARRWTRYAGLPKWARDELDRLARQVERGRQAVAEGPADSDTFLVTAFGLPDRPLGTEVRIHHQQGGDDRKAFRATFRNGAVELESWCGGIAVTPKSTNRVTIRRIDD